MKIECNKEEFAEMLSKCVGKCPDERCPLYEYCQTAYVDTLTKIITITETEGKNGSNK